MKSALAFTTLLILAVSVQAVTIETVPVGNPNNAGDVQQNGTFGSVAYRYRIGNYEVTNAQYVEFLNAVDATGANTLALYSSFMTSDARGGIDFTSDEANGSKYSVKTGRDSNPVVFVSWYDAIRFANWMHTGGVGDDTEKGAYTLGPLGALGIPLDSNSITRNPGATWWLPSENEWYKAAYHKNDGVTGNYWDYPTATDAIPYSDQPPGTDAPDASNTANIFKNNFLTSGYDDGYAVTGSTVFVSSQNYLTDVGTYTTTIGPYGTFDQAGNVWEWNELLGGGFRGRRGGSWRDGASPTLASFQSTSFPVLENDQIGFRMATIIPEPNALLISAVVFAYASICRRRVSVQHRHVRQV